MGAKWQGQGAQGWAGGRASVSQRETVKLGQRLGVPVGVLAGAPNSGAVGGSILVATGTALRSVGRG